MNIKLPARVAGMILFALAIANNAVAQQGGNQVINLNKAIELGLAHSYQLKIGTARNEAAAATTGQAVATMVPNVDLMASYTRISNNITPFRIALAPGEPAFTLNPQILNNYNNRASISEVIFSGLRARNALDAVKLQQQASNLDYQRSKSGVQANVISSYYNLYKMLQMQKLIQENIKLTQENLVNAQNRSKEGLNTENDVMRVSLQRSNLELTRVEVDNNAQAANYQLSVLLGLPAGTTIQLDTNNLFGLHQIGSFDALLNEALQTRQDLKAANIRYQGAKKQYLVQRGSYLPTLTAGANYYYNNPNARIFPPQPIWKNTWDAGLTLNYNVTSLYSNRFRMAGARAGVTESLARHDQVSDDVRIELNNSYLALRRDQQKLELAQNAVRQATENYRVMNNKYLNNVAILTELLDANLLLLQARIDLASSRADSEIAWYNLQHALGTL